MTVAELIELLKDMPQDADACVLVVQCGVLEVANEGGKVVIR